MVDQPNIGRMPVTRHPLKPRRIPVARVEPIVRDYVRVTFAGADLADFGTLDPSERTLVIAVVLHGDAPAARAGGLRSGSLPGSLRVASRPSSPS